MKGPEEYQTPPPLHEFLLCITRKYLTGSPASSSDVTNEFCEREGHISTNIQGQCQFFWAGSYPEDRYFLS